MSGATENEADDGTLEHARVRRRDERDDRVRATSEYVLRRRRRRGGGGGGGGMSSKRTMWCPGEAVSLYDPANAMKGNYKHMAMVETIPWRGPAMGNVLLAWQTSEKIEGTRQRLVIAEAEGKELRFKALTANKQRDVRRRWQLRSADGCWREWRRLGSEFVRQPEEKSRNLVVLFAIENRWVRVESARMDYAPEGIYWRRRLTS